LTEDQLDSDAVWGGARFTHRVWDNQHAKRKVAHELFT
jgi:hypothetical protein